ncbi:hypothetical protein HDV06_001803 [Boothiomyces sp. JEL0866]|nr:hypothetical protein HDV06_001803 [Boothiomyces sp. JEL0866]
MGICCSTEIDQERQNLLSPLQIQRQQENERERQNLLSQLQIQRQQENERERQNLLSQLQIQRQQENERERERTLYEIKRIDNHIAKLKDWNGPETQKGSENQFVYFNSLNIQAVIELINSNRNDFKSKVLLNYRIFEDDKLTVKYSKTFVTGEFICIHSKKKKSSWESGKICMEIFMNEKMDFCVKVWNQKCRVCNRINTPKLYEEIYTERLISKLLLMMGLRKSIPYSSDKKTPPHRQSLCCACIAGVCTESLVKTVK